MPRYFSAIRSSLRRAARPRRSPTRGARAACSYSANASASRSASALTMIALVVVVLALERARPARRRRCPPSPRTRRGSRARPLPTGATKSASDRCGSSSALRRLLAQHGEARELARARASSVKQHDVVAVAARPARSRRRRAPCSSRSRDDALEQRAARRRTARAPPRRTSGASRIVGKRPFSSQAVKKKVQSM